MNKPRGNQFPSDSIMKGPERVVNLQLQSANKTCADCSTKRILMASVSYGIFLCIDCAMKHKALGHHNSFLRSVNVPSWSEIEIKKMEVGGNEKLNAFFSERGIPKETDILEKYKTKAAADYRDQIQALAQGRPWQDPPTTNETIGGSSDGMRRRRRGDHTFGDDKANGGGGGISDGEKESKLDGIPPSLASNMLSAFSSVIQKLPLARLVRELIEERKAFRAKYDEYDDSTWLGDEIEVMHANMIDMAYQRAYESDEMSEAIAHSKKFRSSSETSRKLRLKRGRKFRLKCLI